MNDKDFVDLRDELARQQRPAAVSAPVTQPKNKTGLIIGLIVGGVLFFLGLLALIISGFFGLTRMVANTQSFTEAIFAEAAEMPVEVFLEVTEMPAAVFIPSLPSLPSLPVPHIFHGLSPDAVTASGVRFAASDVDALNLNFLNNSISIATHDDSDIHVVFVAPENRNYVRPLYQLAGDGTLMIFDDAMDILPSLTNAAPGHISVHVPVTTFEFIKLLTTNGDISVHGVGELLARNINITAVNGTIDIANFQSRTASASSINGAVTGRSVHFDGDVTMSTVNGTVRLDDSQVGGILSASTVTGNVDITDVDTGTPPVLSTVLGRVDVRP